LATFKHFKEDYMAPMNEFIDLNKDILLELYSKISNIEGTQPPSQPFTPIKVPKDVIEGSLVLLRDHIAKPDILPKLKDIFVMKQNTFINEYLNNIEVRESMKLVNSTTSLV